jgi:hypothetical protein
VGYARIDSMNKQRFCKACGELKTFSGRLCQRCATIKYKYRVNPSQVHKLMRQGGFICQICKVPQYDKKLVVDHCHETGNVRGFLCLTCNLGLGYLKTPEMLEEAIKYLNGPPPELQYYSPSDKCSDDHLRESMDKVLGDSSLTSLRAKSKVLAVLIERGEEASMSLLRRYIAPNSENSLDIPA